MNKQYMVIGITLIVISFITSGVIATDDRDLIGDLIIFAVSIIMLWVTFGSLLFIYN